MRELLKHFTLYDLIGYFTVGIVSYLCWDLAIHHALWQERLCSIFRHLSNLTIYQGAVIAIAAYMLGQVLGSLSQFFYFKLPCIKRVPCHNYPKRAYKDWVSLRDKILPVYGRNHITANHRHVFWLCVALSREKAPSTYGDAFKWLIYSGASRSLSLVVLSLAVYAGWNFSVWQCMVLLFLAYFFYYTFYRMLEQYHKEVINSVLLLLNGH